jgi:hypothetical protein
MIFSQPERQHGVAEVVPIDHEFGSTEPGSHQTDEQSWNRGRILDEEEIGPFDFPQKEPKQVKELPNDSAQRKRHKKSRGQPTTVIEGRRKKTASNALTFLYSAKHRLPPIPDQVHVNQMVGEREGMVLHSRASTQIS